MAGPRIGASGGTRPGIGFLGPAGSSFSTDASLPAISTGSASAKMIIDHDSAPQRLPGEVVPGARDASPDAYAPLLMSDPDAAPRKPARQPVRRTSETTLWLQRQPATQAHPGSRNPGAVPPDLG